MTTPPLLALMGVTYSPPKEQLSFIEITPGEPEGFIEIEPASPVEPVDPHPNVKPGVKLFKFQQEAVEWLRDKPGALLADEMGVGKTAAAIAWGASRRPVLVICPASLVINWARKELGELWRRNDSVVVLDGTVDIPKPIPDWTVCSYGQVGRYLGDIQRAGYQAVIVDEAHKLRNLDTTQSRNVLEIVAPEKAAVGQKIPPFRLALTGTPIVNSALDAFPLMLFMGLRTWDDLPGFRFAMRRRAEQAPSAVYAILKPVMLRRKKADVYPDLPPKVYENLVVPITNADEYDLAENAFLDWLRQEEGSLHSRAQIEAQALVRLQALRGLVAAGKVAPVADWLTPCGAGGVKTLLFSTRIEPLEELQKRHPASILYTGVLSKEDRQTFVDKFQKDPGLCYFMGTYGAAAVGITLTAADRVVLFDLPWTPADKQQAEDRAHRFGQKRTVEVVSVVAKNTVDERVLELLDEKEQVIAEAVEGESSNAAAKGSVAGDLLRRLRREASEPGRSRQPTPKYISDEDAEEEWAEQRQENHPPSSLYIALRQAVMGQIPDDWGSRCRDPLGRWTISDLCPPVPRGEVAATAMTFALSADGTRRFEFQHRVVEATDLITSHDPFTFELNPRFTQKLQPRRRERAATQVQVQKIAKDLEPLSLLTDFRTFDRGAPIVAEDMLVESGNGRVMGYIRASQEYPERVADYRAALLAHIAEFGLTAQDVEGKILPLLIRERVTQLTDAERQKFVEEANLPSGITRSAVEIARTDAERITLDLLLTLDVGEEDTLYDALKATRNRVFVQRFLGTLPENERGQLLDSTGVVNLDGIRRIGQAVFVYVFRDETGLKLAELAFETLDNDIRNAFGGIARALGPMAQGEALTTTGARAQDLAIGEDLATTLRVYVRLRGAGTSVADYLAQGQLESRELTPFQEDVLKTVAGRARSAKRIGEVLRRYAEAVIAQPPPSQGGLFGDVRIGKEELWQAARAGEQMDYEAETAERARRREERAEPSLVAGQGPGVYVSFTLSPESDNWLRQFVVKDLGLPIPTWPLHITTVYSRAPFQYDARTSWPSEDLELAVLGYEILTGQSGKPSLVLRVDAEALWDSHMRAQKAGASFDFPEYKPHITLAYDAEGIRPSALAKPWFALTLAPHENIEPLQEDWALASLSLVAQLRQAIGMSARDPKASVDWCNLDPERIDAAWAWRPFRDAIAEGRGLRAKVQVCGSELSPDSYILAADFTGTPHHGTTTGEVMERYRRRVKAALGENARQVLEFGTNRVIFEVVLPGAEPENLTFRPQDLPILAPRREEGTMQPALFQAAQSKDGSAPAQMRAWQYKVLIAELQQLQTHASDPTCPCGLADIGEFCHAKHLLSICALAWETASMDHAPANHDMLTKLGDEANDLHMDMRVFVQNPHDSKSDVNLVEWSRTWRKQLESIYYSKEMRRAEVKELATTKPRAKAAQEDSTAIMSGPVYTPVTFTGQRGSITVDVLVDTGAQACQVTPGIVAAINPVPLGDIQAKGLGGIFETPMVFLSDIEIQGRKLSDVWRMPDAFLAMVGDVPLVGHWVLQELRLDVHPSREAISLAQDSAKAEMGNLTLGLEQAIGSTISGLGWALGAALAGFIIAMLNKRNKEEEDRRTKATRGGDAIMSVDDLLPMLDGMIKKLGV